MHAIGGLEGVLRDIYGLSVSLHKLVSYANYISVPILGGKQNENQSSRQFRKCTQAGSPNCTQHLAFFDCGGVRLMLTPPEKPEFDHPSSILYFKVDDIQAAFDRLVQKGVKAEDKPHIVARMPDHDLWLAEFRDSEGNLMSLMSEVRNEIPPDSYLPIQNRLKIKLRMSSLVVAPVISSSGRRAL
ncbi:MAG: hypothetical protein DMG94_06995 [Acidobacteria bacterium]|nr:MAG: hypothetical protein DMG94_06995 [Acidobacteriota bacterium]